MSNNLKFSFNKLGQRLYLMLGLWVVVRPFTSLFFKLHYLTRFAAWKSKYLKTSALKDYDDRFSLYQEVITREKLDHITYLEFGVFRGQSIRWWMEQIQNPNAHFFGFDTFEGIPEAWGKQPVGTYTNQGQTPLINDPRCKLVKGLFQDTLMDVKGKFNLEDRLVIHLDADLYSSTLYCLITLGPYLKSGDILIFDEFIVTTHEFRAYLDFQSIYHYETVLIGATKNCLQVVLKIT